MNDKEITAGCLALIVYAVIGGWSVNYLLAFFLEKTIPFIGAALIGLIVGEVSIPVAIVVIILRWFGIV